MRNFLKRNLFIIGILFIAWLLSFAISYNQFSSMRQNISLTTSKVKPTEAVIQNTSNEKSQEITQPSSFPDKVPAWIKPLSCDSEIEIAAEIEKEKALELEKARLEELAKKKLEEKNAAAQESGKVAYLTFDDGPSPNVTPKILDILKTYNVKATFFVVGTMAEKNPEILKRTRDEGHAIANHTYSHVSSSVYSSPQGFMDEIHKCENTLKSILGDYDGKIIRFPGGSFGDKLKPYKDMVQSQGYTYIDWNCINGDAEALSVPPDKLVLKVKETSWNQKNLIVLMHDAPAKETTSQALPQIIEYLQSQNYSFKMLNK